MNLQIFPEFALATDTVVDRGVNREVVYDKSYGNVTMTFTCDQEMLIKKFFDEWVQFAVQDNGGRFTYPDRYIADNIDLYQLNAAKDAAYAVVLKRVYPKVVNDIYVASNATTPSSFSVQFTYESWTSYQIPQETEVEITVNNGKKSTAPKKESFLSKLLHRYFNIPTLDGLQKQITGIATGRLQGLVGEKAYSVDSKINKTVNDVLGQTRNKLYGR